MYVLSYTLNYFELTGIVIRNKAIYDWERPDFNFFLPRNRNFNPSLAQIRIRGKKKAKKLITLYPLP